MDLRPITTPPTADERAAVEAVLGAEGSAPSAWAEAASQRHLLLPVLHALNERVGWVSPGGLGEACRRLSVPPAEGYGVASFYALFSMTPRPATVVHVCDDFVCMARGAQELCDSLEERAGAAGEGATWLRSPCLGLCEQAPAAMITVAGAAPRSRSWGHVTAAQVESALVTGQVPESAPTRPSQRLRLLKRVGIVDPTSLQSYREHGGYSALRKALERGPAWVIGEITESKLMGRGGAAFPTGRKWAAVAGQAVKERWLVCNADESEPGTFKDRVLMEEDPFALVEAMTIAGIATGCERGILYLRGEYPLCHERMGRAIAEARRAGLLGELAPGVRFELEIRKGAGAYICGEETALFNSIEGMRGEPRSKPPFPVEVGLFGKPTLVNNVETLANVPDIVLEGGAAFAAIGTAGSTGTRLFCLSGHVQRPGIYEVPFGTRLSELIALAGGASGAVQAVLLGGAAGTFVGPGELEMPLTFEDTRKAGATLGSGVVVVLNESVDLVPYLQRIASFFRDESCGQCVPCRVGTVRQEELLGRLARRAPHGSWKVERKLIAELGQCMRDASICGLGQTASSAIESALAKFPSLMAEDV